MFGKKDHKPEARPEPASTPSAAPASLSPAPMQQTAPQARIHSPEPLAEGPALPLFYKDPRPLSSIEHAKFKLVAGDAGFAADTNSVPIVASEFAEAARSFPIVFAAGDAAPCVLLGLERANVFVDQGQWAEGVYMPAYVRRYPFVFIGGDDNQFALGVDMGSGRISETGEGAPLFDEEGKASALAQQALAFCQEFQMAHQMTRLFSAALKEKNLLIDRRADITLPGGRTMALQGFEIVDVSRLATLDEATIVDWHRKGWLALVHFHLASLSGFRDLLSRHSAQIETPLAR